MGDEFLSPRPRNCIDPRHYLGDRFGRRTFHLIGVAGFTVVSVEAPATPVPEQGAPLESQRAREGLSWASEPGRHSGRESARAADPVGRPGSFYAARCVSHVRFGRQTRLPSTTLHQVW